MDSMPYNASAALDVTDTGLFVRDTHGAYRPASRRDVLGAAHAVVDALYTRGETLQSPANATRYLTIHFADKQHEVFTMLLLDSQHRLLDIVDLFRGTVDGCSVYPREIVKLALAANASAVILAHNHPSGLPEPSAADRAITDRVKSALQIIDVRVLDHLVIGGTKTVSFAERGWL